MKEDLIKKLLEWMNNSEHFLSDQLPDIGNQLIQYERISDWMGLSFAFLIIIIAIFIFCFVEGGDWDVFPCLLKIFSFIGMIISVVVIACCSTDLVQSYMTPKAYLIKSLTSGCHR